MAVGTKGESNCPIFSYQLYQNALVPLLAKTIALGLFHVKCKDIFQIPKGHEHDLLDLCCIDKTMNGWNLERVASIFKERCDGQGYLSVNKFGDYLAIAHASLTAEGDNRVLMVKICKDMMTNNPKKGFKFPQISQCSFRKIVKADNIITLQTMLELLKYSEIVLYNQLVEGNKKMLQEGKSSFIILMRESSDLIQGLAMVYGER